MSEHLKPAWGGVVWNAHRHILLVRPKDGYGNMAWTFPKGRPEVGETAEACAVREVLEEAGVRAQITAAVPGHFDGDLTRTGYFHMRSIETGLAFDDKEIEAIGWALPIAAAALLGQTLNPKSRARDLAVLKAALGALPDP